MTLEAWKAKAMELADEYAEMQSKMYDDCCPAPRPTAEQIGAARAALAAHLSAVPMGEAVATERKRAALVCDDEARIRREAGETHPEESPSRGRCFAAARAAINCAKGVRNGEVVWSSPKE